jgi:hypothetical protein
MICSSPLRIREEARKGDPLSMAGKIFYRERVKYTDGAQMPRYMLVAVHDVDLRVYGQHLRMAELKALAEATGAELVALPRGEHSGHKRLEALQAKAGPA